MIENSTKKIISTKTDNKIQTENKSTNMEYSGFSACMYEKTSLKLVVAEIVTDSHSQITKNLSEYSNRIHAKVIYH